MTPGQVNKGGLVAKTASQTSPGLWYCQTSSKSAGRPLMCRSRSFTVTAEQAAGKKSPTRSFKLIFPAAISLKIPLAVPTTLVKEARS